MVAPSHPDDPTRSLVAAWRAAAGPVVVLPAGGLALRDLAASRLVTAGGLGLFRHDAVRLDERPPEEATPKLRETLAVQRWFAERTGTTMPWGLSALPQGLPPLDRLPDGELEDLLDDPARPPLGRHAIEAHLPVWWSYLQAAAVPGSLRITRLRAGSRRYVRGVSDLVTGRDDLDAVSVDADSLVGDPEAVAQYERLLAARQPIAAPWE